MTHMHDNFALPLDAIHVLVIKKLFCAQHTYIQDHEIVLLRYDRRSKFVVGTSRTALYKRVEGMYVCKKYFTYLYMFVRLLCRFIVRQKCSKMLTTGRHPSIAVSWEIFGHQSVRQDPGSLCKSNWFTC